MFRVINKGDGRDELNIAGSNEEKMSDIIVFKIWWIPFRTLKVLSLINLIFYVICLLVCLNMR